MPASTSTPIASAEGKPRLHDMKCEGPFSRGKGKRKAIVKVCIRAWERANSVIGSVRSCLFSCDHCIHGSLRFQRSRKTTHPSGERGEAEKSKKIASWITSDRYTQTYRENLFKSNLQGQYCQRVLPLLSVRGSTRKKKHKFLPKIVFFFLCN
jgi:hypothetical protein